ncbi:MAG: FtsH protease activity modulator HflK [Spirochaetales bacterium]|nr:FtsH protease activity modulator HflK [Spirochaetales bacterium]
MSDQDVKNIVKMPNSRFIGLIIVVIAILLVLANSFYQVDAQEQAVVLNFGKFQSIEEPGFHFKLPIIQKVYKVNTKEINTMNFGFVQQSGMDSTYRGVPEESNLLTGDSNILDIRWSIQYRITNPRDWLFNVDNGRVRSDMGYDMDNREKTIRDISQSVINKIIGDNSLNRIFEGKRDVLVIQALSEMNDRVNKVGLGITISLVEFDTMAAPEGEVQSAFSDVTAATVERDRYIDEGEVYRSSQIPNAQGEAQRIKELADGYAIQRVNLARGDVAKFTSIYEEYKKNPTITRKRMYYEMMEELAKTSANIELIDKDLTNFIPFKSLNTQGGN